MKGILPNKYKAPAEYRRRKMKRNGIIILLVSEILIIGIICLIGETTKAWFHEVGKAQLIASLCSPILLIALMALPPIILSKCSGLYKLVNHT